MQPPRAQVASIEFDALLISLQLVSAVIAIHYGWDKGNHFLDRSFSMLSS